jgi:citrate lyase subunit beta/citryl-CoA lyase
MDTHAMTGNHGEGIRSDCRVTLELKEKGGVQIDIQSKVDSMFGNSIRQLLQELVEQYSIRHAHLLLEDSGALPHVIAARTEAAIRKVSNTRVEFLLPMAQENTYRTERDRFRLSRLYLPGNTPSLMINAGIHRPYGVILDLEDSVAPDRKDEARILVRNSLRAINFYGAERMVRINQLPLGLEDAAVVAPHNVHVMLIPKCEEDWQVQEVEKVVRHTLEPLEIEQDIYFMPIIESALGVENAYQIATASKHVVAMAIGLEDLTADLGVPRTADGNESLYARTRLINACKAAGIQPIDSVFSDVNDMDGLLENVKRSKALGFEGMGSIHPRQIQVIHQGFRPTEAEIEKAAKIVMAFREAREKGRGVVSLGSKMIDAPVVRRAEQTLEMAKQFGLDIHTEESK